MPDRRTRRGHAHPSWCGQGHVCSADRPGGEHRSAPLTVDHPPARLVATRTRTTTGRDRIEVRTVVDLPAHPGAAREMAQQVMLRLADAVAPCRHEGTA